MADQIRATANLQQAIKELNKYRKALEQIEKPQKDLGKTVFKSVREFDSLGKAVGFAAKRVEVSTKQLADFRKETIRTTIENRKGKDVITAITRTIENDERARQKSIKTIKREASELAKFVETKKRELAARKSTKAIESQVRQLGAIAPRATTAEILNFKQQQGKLKALAAQSGVTTKEISRQFRELRSGQPKAYADVTLRRIQSQTAAVLKAHQALGASSTKNLARIRKEAERLLASQDKVKKSSQGMLISFQSLARFAAFRVLSSGVFALQSAIRETIGEATELQIRLSSIRTISTERQLPLEGWATQLRQISDAWRLDLLDAAEAGYLAVSNQVAKGAQVFPFLISAAKLAATGVATVSESVSLLTSAINAYDLDVTEADELSAKFFRTVELGRIRISDLADTFGTVAIPASQIGVSVDEVNAALATLTIQGVKPANAMTFLRNVLLKLIQPTDTMKKLFDDIGVSSGEAAVQAFGFGGLLAEIDKRAGGSSTELGKLFSRIRALQGGFGLTGRSLERFNFNLEQISNSTESFAERVGIATESAGFKIDREIKRIKNFFTEDLGQTIITTLAEASEAIGGFANFLDKTLIPAIKGTSAALSVLAVRLLIIKKAFISTALINPLAAAVIGVGIATAAIVGFVRENEKLAQQAADDWASSFQDQAAEAIKQTTQIEKRLIQFTSAQIRSGAERLKAVNSEIVSLSKQVSEELKNSSEAFKKSTETTVDDLSDTIRKLNKEVSNSKKAFQNAEQGIKDLQKELDTQTFEAQFNIGDVSGEVNAIENRLGDIRQAAVEAIQKGELGIATQLFGEERALIVRLGKIGKETAESVNLTQRALSETIKEQINLLDQGQERAKQRQLQRIEELKRAEVAKNKFVAAQKTLAETELFKILQIRDDEAISEAVKARGEAIKNIAANAELLGLDSGQIRKLFSDFESFSKQATLRISKLQAQENQKNASEFAKLAQDRLKSLREEQEQLTQNLLPLNQIDALAKKIQGLVPRSETNFLAESFNRLVAQSKFFSANLKLGSEGAKNNFVAISRELKNLQKARELGRLQTIGPTGTLPGEGTLNLTQKQIELLDQIQRRFEIIKTTGTNVLAKDFIGMIKSLKVVDNVISNVDSNLSKTRKQNAGNVEELTEQQEKQKEALSIEKEILDALKNVNKERQEGSKILDGINTQLKEQKREGAVVPGTSQKIDPIINPKIEVTQDEINKTNRKLSNEIIISPKIAAQEIPKFAGTALQGFADFIPKGGATSKGATAEAIEGARRRASEEQQKAQDALTKSQARQRAAIAITSIALTNFASVIRDGKVSFGELVNAIGNAAAGILNAISGLGQQFSQFGIAGSAIAAGLGILQVVGVDSLNLAKGGMVPKYLAGGGDVASHPGSPQGSDTVPIWATPGEFMMNKQATDQFFPILKAMNSGVKHMAEGGAVGNSTTVGDIIINQTSTGNVRQDAKEMGKLIRQEINNGFAPRLG